MLIYINDNFVLKCHHFFVIGACEDWPPYKSLKKIELKIVIKDNMTRRVDILWCILRIMQKIKIEVTVPKKEQLFTVFGEIGKKNMFFRY